MGYENRSRVAFLNYDEIQPQIVSKELDSYDIVYTRDTHQNILISPDLSLIPINYRVYKFESVEIAEEFLNYSSDTYEGQLVSIIFRGKFTAYIVNRNDSDRFYVEPLNEYSGEIDYDTLRNRPVTRLSGSLENPIIVSGLKTGIYTIKGQYNIAPETDTTYLSNNSNIFLVEHDSDGCHIRKITSKDIVNYTISSIDGTLSTSIIPTTDYLREQGYATIEYVDTRLAAMNFLTKDEVNTYVAKVVMETIDNILDERIEVKIDEKFKPATNDMIVGLFN